MRKLLSANFSRLWKEKIFWICMGGMLAYSIVYMLNACRQATKDMAEYQYSIDSYYFCFAIVIGGFCAVFCSMFFGTEYSDGTIRNKIIVGHTRESIYLANLILTFTATLLIMLVWLLGALIAIPTLGVWKMPFSSFLLYLLIAVIFVAAFSAIFTFICMLSSNKAVTVAVSFLSFLGLIVVASLIYARLAEPELLNGVIITANGMEMGDPTPNSRYISGTVRRIYQGMLDFLPTGQGLQMWQLEIQNPVRMLVFSVIITVGTTFGGILIFKKKNLK